MAHVTCPVIVLVGALVGALVMAPACAARPACGPDALGTGREIGVGGEARPLGLQSYPRTLALEDHEVVLTFDDGPAAPTPAVLNALAAECVKATFFLIGRNAETMPQLVKREIAEGHSVGHHSYSHPERTLRLMSEEAAKADIDKGIAAVEKAGYGEAAATPHTPFFRFPGYADTKPLLAWLAGRGVTVFGSDLWASDWSAMTPKAELELVMSRLEKAGKGVILFHDSKAATAKMLPDFLRELKKRGYRVAHMVPGPGPTPVEPAGPGWKSTTEPIIEKTLGGHGRGTPGGGHVHPPSEPEAPAEKAM
jgi:peptidoglycan/xylan/chitin deacetylase (PgdA/CDA1 family)